MLDVPLHIDGTAEAEGNLRADDGRMALVVHAPGIGYNKTKLDDVRFYLRGEGRALSCLAQAKKEAAGGTMQFVFEASTVDSLLQTALSWRDLTRERYSGELKMQTACINSHQKETFLRTDIEDKGAIDLLFGMTKFDKILHLAAQAGVRYSIANPYAYMHSNYIGFLNILECCRNFGVEHLVYASSSSVYGLNSKVPFSEDDVVISPVSLYAASKKSNELMAHAYCKLYGTACTGLRYFTVYGPAGRPDMAPMLFAEAIMQGKPIKVFNHGDMMRDFTYIDDIANGTLMVLDSKPDPARNPNNLPYRIYNIGLGSPVNLMDFIGELENGLGRNAEKILLPMQPGDVSRTWADTTRLETEIGYKPRVTLKEGIREFVKWFNEYHGL